jgi:sporulation protein YlmC with PRC-barrel domain
MKKRLRLVLALVFTIGIGTMAYGQQPQGQGTLDRGTSDRGAAADNRGTAGMARSSDVNRFRTVTTSGDFKASDLMGMRIENNQGESLGRISDLAVDPVTGKVDFAVVGYGGFLGIGDKHVAVPIHSMALKADDSGNPALFVLDMSRDQFQAAPNFDEKAWRDRTTVEESFRYFGQTPTWKEQGDTSSKWMKEGAMNRGTDMNDATMKHGGNMNRGGSEPSQGTH